MKKYNIYGDNIVECERVVEIIQKGGGYKIIERRGNPTNIELVATRTNGDVLEITLYPGFGRWENSIIENMELNGTPLREAPDSIVTKIDGEKEQALVAIEFCSALPAGNQAWQRSGRAYSYGKLGVPYLYITEIGGYELDINRNKKAPRLPNPAVPFSYTVNTKRQLGTTLIINTMSPGADDFNKEKYLDAISDEIYCEYVVKVIEEDKAQFELAEEIRTRSLKYIEIMTKDKKGYVKNYWEILGQICEKNDVIDHLKKMDAIKWSKSVTIKTTPNFKLFLKVATEIGQGVTSKNLPFCLIPAKKIGVFKEKLNELGGCYEKAIPTNRDLVICWVAGFKPRGDDSRPDRGLLPLVRMLVGDQVEVLTVVYGPAPEANEKLFEQDRVVELIERNGLWQAIFTLSDSVVVEALTFNKTQFMKGIRNRSELNIEAKNNTINMQRNKLKAPLKYGENDVDSVIHYIYKHIYTEQTQELMCNPPGGDWSGISMFIEENEYRWLSLPRVTADGSKRPDHVIEIESEDTILTIESKEAYNTLEVGIGPRLTLYCKELFKSMPSAVRKNGLWSDITESYSERSWKYLTGAAYIKKDLTNILDARRSSGCDLIYEVIFRKDGHTVVEITPITKGGEEHVRLLQNKSVPQKTNLELIYKE
jgi:hypothetical protein